MIRFLNLDEFIKKLVPVSTSDYFTRDGSFNDNGLFSEKIFGPKETIDRRKSFSYIDLNTYVVHPSALKLLFRLDQKIKKFITAESSFSLDNKGILIEDPNGVTGIKEFIKIFPKIKFRGEDETRDKFIKVLQDSYKNNTLFVRYVPIIPPDFRPAYQDKNGQWTFDALNDIYLTVLRRSFQVKTSGTGPLFDLLNYGLQSAVIDHDNFIRMKLQKKQGLIRQQILGKRVDFSGRAVITPEPKLKINEIGIPFRLAVGIFEPFITYQLIHSGKTNKEDLQDEIHKFLGLTLSIESIHIFYKSIKNGDSIPSSLYKIFFDATERAISGRVVLAKRDPVLQAESYRGFYPVLTHGDTVQICALQVGGFNADFDGDQMAIYHPLSNESQQEIKDKLMRLTTGTSSTGTTYAFSKEMWLGLYMLTKVKPLLNSPILITPEKLNEVKDPYISVKYRGYNTTAGFAIFNSCFPTDFDFNLEQVTKKVLNKLLDKATKMYDLNLIREICYNLEQAAFKWATIFGSSINIKDLDLPENIMKLKEELKKSKTVEEADKIIEKATIKVASYLEDTGFGEIVMSGAGKGMGQPMQILFAKGIIADPNGKILDPIKESFSDGLTNVSYFNASSGARKGIIDRVINTADTGYMSRKLAYLLNSVEVDRYLIDCKTTNTLDIKLDSDIIKRLTGRFYLKGGAIHPFEPSLFKDGDLISLRSPIFCKSPKLCHTCYGRLIERHRTPYVGILASQIIGERGTQLIMRTFHTGGAVTIIKKNMLEDISNNDPMILKEKLSTKLTQRENQLVTEESCTIILDLVDDYSLNDNMIINEEENIIWVKSLIAKVEYKDYFFHMILDFECNLELKNMEKIGKEMIKLSYDPGEVILNASLESAEMKGMILYVERLIGGRELVRDASHLLRKLMKIYGGGVSDMDLVHLEILISQCLRDKKDPRYPARLGKIWNPTMINMKAVVFSEGFIQGLAFENINNAISQGLISEEKPENSVIEKLLLGQLVQTKEKK